MNIRWDELFKLSPAERIQLAEDLWDSVAADPEKLPPLTEDERVEIDRRMDDFARNPSSGVAWEDLRTRLWSRIIK
jgi:putative addiction module component (TIGR02574 family)